MEHSALLRRLYNDPANAAGYAGLEPLYREARARRPSITRDEVQHFLEGDRTYTLFKPTRNRYPRLRTRPRGFLTDLQADLADFQKLAEHNRGFRYLLVAVDVLSRRVFVEPTRSKSSRDMKHAFDRLFRQLPHLPWSVFTDNVGFQAFQLCQARCFRALSSNLVRCEPTLRRRVCRNMRHEATM